MDDTTTRAELIELLATAKTSDLLHILETVRLHSWQMRAIRAELKSREI